ncbi:uncharacterized protein LOC133205121 [Saccostrea echinata]|uniref:uncharacterized protein LOC133205121 n=1 Tax=Saccostrea echinata TaxID=191078 RepID=UPI002A7FF746|nr:uncharacterized protein LOC133205121 [Saccostrea echinata]
MPKGKIKIGYPNESFVGKGAMFADIAKESLRIRMHVNRVNELEQERLHKLTKLMNRDQRVHEFLRQRVMDRTERNIEQLRGYREVIGADYKFDNFQTMKHGFKKRRVESPRTARQISLETKIYNGGYQPGYFKHEIKRKIRQADPNVVHRVVTKILKEQCQEESGKVLDRKLSDMSYYRTLREQQQKGQFHFKPQVRHLIPVSKTNNKPHSQSRQENFPIIR